jgi:hypothetical protein
MIRLQTIRVVMHCGSTPIPMKGPDAKASGPFAVRTGSYALVATPSHDGGALPGLVMLSERPNPTPDR